MTPKYCAVCNEPFDPPVRQRRPKLYCSDVCKGRAAGAMRRPDMQLFIPKLIDCGFCQTAFLPFSRRSRYCSQPCRVMSRFAHVAPKPVHTVVCQCCGTMFTTANLRKRYCNPSCRIAHATAIAKPDYVDNGLRNACTVYFRQCFSCGADVCTRHPGRGLCDKCRVVRRRWSDTKKNARRRAAGVMRVSREQLLELRGNRCHICTKLIDLTLSGLHPRGFTVDHIFPVSKGGTNDVSNLHVAHRSCNTAKGNRGHAQLVLDEDAGPATQAC